MSFPRRYKVSAVTDASGNATAYSDPVTGKISAIIYVKDGTTPFSTGVGFTITSETTGENLWVQANVNASAKVAPRQPTHGTDGTAALYAAAGTAVLDEIALANDRVKIVVASGGNAKNGSFWIVVE